MSGFADLIRNLAALGTPPEAIALAVEAVEAEQTKIAEGRAKVRDRKRAERERARQSRDSHATVTDNSLSPAPSFPPDPQTNPTPIPVEDTPRARKGWACPEGVDRDHWRDFLANRRTRKLTCSETAYRGQLRVLAELSDDEWPPGKLVQHAAEKGWGSINDPRDNRDGLRNRTNTVGGREPDSLLAALERARAEERAEASSSFDQANDPGAWGSLPPQLASHAGRA